MLFADDTVICSESRKRIKENPQRWRFFRIGNEGRGEHFWM